MRTRLTLGYSPCPNDCFIFDALVNGKIDTQGIDFEVVLEDVETLNAKAFAGELDVTKLSYHAFTYLTDAYSLLDSGSALGFNCGPILITKSDEVKDLFASHDAKMQSLKIAIPGKYTTANFLLSLAYPSAINKTEVVFSEIEDLVLSGKMDAGLIIHENRFTYESKGLKKIADLGEYWDSIIHAPIPLGGIVVKKSLDVDLQRRVNGLIRRSVEFAQADPESCMPYVRRHAQEMSEDVMKKHIALYVNDFTVNLGEAGRAAVLTLFEKAKETKLVERLNDRIFVE